MNKLTCTLAGLGFAAAAFAQPALAQTTLPGGPESEAAQAEPAAAAAPAANAVTDAQVDAFAAATVKVQAIDADTSIAADKKQEQMRAAVTEAGLDAATYNKIGQALANDTDLRTRVQVAMGKHAGHAEGAPAPTDG